MTTKHQKTTTQTFAMTTKRQKMTTKTIKLAKYKVKQNDFRKMGGGAFSCQLSRNPWL